MRHLERAPSVAKKRQKPYNIKTLKLTHCTVGATLALAYLALGSGACSDSTPTDLDTSPAETDDADTGTDAVYSESDTDTDAGTDTGTGPAEETDNGGVDDCPDDPNKMAPGVCGCGVSDEDADGDSVPNCLDICPSDPEKQDLGICGCGIPDTDRDDDGTPDCKDRCPDDPRKTEPGQCGCGSAEQTCPLDTDSNDSDTDTIHEDKIPPDPGGEGILSVAGVGENTLTLSWDRATDDEAQQDTLTYQVVRSLKPDVDTVDGAEAATIIRPWATDIDSIDVSGLSPGATYYLNVLVRDRFNNKAVYQMVSRTTCRFLGNLTAHFPFSGNFEDLGPHSIPLSPSTSSPSLDLDRDGNVDGSYFFAAANGEYFFNEDYPSPLGIENELTVSLWVKLTGESPDEKIISRAFFNDGYSGWAIGVDAREDEMLLFPEIWDSEGQRYSFVAGSFTPGIWTHLAITWKTGGRFKGYVDGILVQEAYASANPIGNVPGARLAIGARSWKFFKFFVDGNIDDIRIYDWELNETEILALGNLPAD